MFSEVSHCFECDFPIWFETFVDRRICVLVLLILFIDFHSVVCRNRVTGKKP
jgi:hypothetical protein